MTHEWMIDVLADLRQYAIRHYYLRLAEQLDDAIVAAAVELRESEALEEADGEPRGDAGEPERILHLDEARAKAGASQIGAS